MLTRYHSVSAKEGRSIGYFISASLDNEGRLRLPYFPNSRIADSWESNFSLQLRDDFQSALLTCSHFTRLADIAADLLVLIVAFFLQCRVS